MGFVHTRLLGYQEVDLLNPKKANLALGIGETYAIDIVAKDPKILQYLITKLQRFMEDPTIDHEISKMLNTKDGLLVTGDWIEEYGAKTQGQN